MENRISEAKQDTERMVSEIKGAPQLSEPLMVVVWGGMRLSGAVEGAKKKAVGAVEEAKSKAAQAG